MPVFRVLYMSHDGLTDPLGQSQILPYLVGLAQLGHQITLVTLEKPERFQVGAPKVKDLCRQYRIEWIPLRYHNTPPVIATLWDILNLRKTAMMLQRKNNYEIVHCRSYLTSLVGLAVKQKFGVRFLFDMRGFWADERVDGKLWNLNNPLYRLIYKYFKRKEKEFLGRADGVISLTENAKQEIESWEIAKAKITVIPTCADLDLFDPTKINSADKEHLKRKLGIGNEFVLLYLGSWGTWYRTDWMLDFFSALKRLKPKAKFLIVSTDHVDLRGYEYADDVICRSAKRFEVPLHISLAEAAVFFIKPTFSKKASSATKMAEILSMGLPVFTNPGWGDVDYFKDKLAGFHICEESNFSQAIQVSLTDMRDPQSIRQSASQHFSLEKGIQAYNEVYRSLV